VDRESTQRIWGVYDYALYKYTFYLLTYLLTYRGQILTDLTNLRIISTGNNPVIDRATDRRDDRVYVCLHGAIVAAIAPCKHRIKLGSRYTLLVFTGRW